MSEIEHTGAPQRERRQEAEEAISRGRLTELRQHLYGAATQQMLEAAKLQPEDQILDIAAGTGDQSRQAAQQVRPEGSVLATDISQEMLDVAARLAQHLLKLLHQQSCPSDVGMDLTDAQEHPGILTQRKVNKSWHSPVAALTSCPDKRT